MISANGHAGHQRDRRKILHGIIGQLLVQRLVDGERGRGRHQQRVAVGLGFGDLLGAERGAGARLVLDDDGRVKPALDLVGDQPAEKIGGAAGRIRHDHLDGTAGIGGLRLRGRRPPAKPSAAATSVQSPPGASTHGVLPFAFSCVFANHYSRSRRHIKGRQRSISLRRCKRVVGTLDRHATLIGYDGTHFRLSPSITNSLISQPALSRRVFRGIHA